MKLAVTAIILMVVSAPWFYNAYKFSQCDFKSNYRCEALHAIGVLVPPASYVTVWFEHDNEINNN